ncbi:hypothetical protein [Kitasatospora sp. NPDC057015]|uniref:hypothetical protein n=1 Tax=Kitasatospora sp. NPDC057015 TaxID=3346001 RepID=UPI00363442F7
MRTPGGWPERTSRGLLCASACLLLGVVAHVAGGGALPGPGALVGLFAAVAVLGTILLDGRGRRRFDVTVSVLAAVQFALHLALEHLSMRMGTVAVGSGTRHDGHQGGGEALSGAHAAMRMPAGMDMGPGPGVIPAVPTTGTPTDGLAGPMAHGMGSAMTVAHALATFGAALCVLHGDRLLRRLAALVVRRLVVSLSLSHRPLPTRGGVPARSVPVAPAHGVLLVRCVPRRGPPVAARA